MFHGGEYGSLGGKLTQKSNKLSRTTTRTLLFFLFPTELIIPRDDPSLKRSVIIQTKKIIFLRTH